MNVENGVRLIVAGVVLLVATVAFFVFFDIIVIQGSQVGVKETFQEGVVDEPLMPATYLVYPWERVQPYSTAVRVFVMNDKHDDPGEGRTQDSYLVQSRDSQDMYLSLQVQWRIDPAHVVNLHKTVGPEGIEERVLRPSLLKIVKNKATMRDAIQAYAGEGLVTLQQDIEKDLADPQGDLLQRGVIVDSFVIEHIRLDPDYVREITARQIAIQKEQRAVQEEKAAQAEALKAKAVAQADLNKLVVEAERDKQVAVLKAEAENEKVILQAQADKQKVVLAAEAEKESGELKAQAILAVGKATAEAETLKYQAFGVEGAEVYARIQVADSMARAFGNIKGYLPENMNVYVLGSNFMNAVENLVKPGVVPQAPSETR
jgi:regulator of protease activity HflC (stomatin/prohibitin superfamily)